MEVTAGFYDDVHGAIHRILAQSKSTGAMATSEQAVPLPRNSQPAARETRAVHTADIHMSEPNGTDNG